MKPPPVTELLDACARWGIDGTAEEYGVTSAQVCAWMRDHPENLPESFDIDAPVVWAGRNMSDKAPSMRTLWEWHRRIEDGEPFYKIAKEHGLTYGIAKRYLTLFEEFVASNQQQEPEDIEHIEEEEVEEKETTEEVDIHAWTTISQLAGQPDAPAIATIATRAESEDPKWAHYESIPVEEVEGNWHPRTTTLYRLREGTGWEALHVDVQAADPKPQVVNYADQAARIASLERELAKARERVESSHKAMEEAISRQVEVEAEERHIRYAIDVLKEALDVADDGKRYPIDAIASDAAKKLKETRERMIGYRNAWQDAEKQEVVYQASIEDLQGQVRRRDERIQELESKLELTPERHDLPLIVEDWKRIKAHLANGGQPAVGSCLAPTIEKLLEHSIELQEVRRLEADGPTEDEAPLVQRLEDLVDLEFEIANLYAVRATDDFAELKQRCWDLKQAKKHYRRREVLMQEWCEEEGR